MKYYYFLLSIFIVFCQARKDKNDNNERYYGRWEEFTVLTMVWSLIPGDLGRYQALGDLLYDMDATISPAIGAFSVFIILVTMTVCFTFLSVQAIFSNLIIWFQRGSLQEFKDFSPEDDICTEE